MTSTSSQPQDVDGIEEYRMHVSQRYLDLTRQKLELARLPKELSDSEGLDDGQSHGVTKAELEPLLDFWLDGFDFRAQEAHLNSQLPQYRTTLRWSRRAASGSSDETLRVHFVHRRSTYKDAIPLLFVHDWGTSFVEVARIIECLCEPVSTPTQTHSHNQAFHVVAPSIPGFGFGDPLPTHDSGIGDVACIFQSLMDKLGYKEFVAYGAGWGFRVVRAISLFSRTCKAIYTTNPFVPPPSFITRPLATLKYHIARLTRAAIPWLSFGYIPSDFHLSSIHRFSSALSPTTNPALAFALSDSPVGLLAFMLHLLPPFPRTSFSRTSPPSTLPTSPSRPRSTTVLPASSTQRSHGRETRNDSLFPIVTSQGYPWSSTDVLTWTMLYWLSGPEAPLRWLENAEKEAANGALYWIEKSAVPLGVTFFRTADRPLKERRDEEPDGAGSKDRRRRWRDGRGLGNDGLATSGERDTAMCPPVWAGVYCDLRWLRRHETGREIKWPAWERGDALVMDMREFVDELRRQGVLGVR